MPKENNEQWIAVEQEADDAQRRDAGLWARCFAQAQGDAARTKALYMTERVRQFGGNVPGAKPKRTAVKWMQYTFFGALFAGAFLLIVASQIPDDGSQNKRAVIDICWNDYKNPALDEKTKQFVAQTCNSLTEEYRRKYGRNP